MEREPADEIARQLRRGSPEAVRAVRRRVRAILAFRSYRIGCEDRQQIRRWSRGLVSRAG